MPSQPNTTRDLLESGARLHQLDILRAAAILLVLLHHSYELFVPAGVFTWLTRLAENFGWSGVDLFFVLSGFLIGGLLFREIQKTGGLRVGRFLIRRGFKIWPGYLALIGYAAIRMIHHGDTPRHVLAMYWPNLLHVQNYIRNIRGLTWSLAVEEHFYLVLPALLGFLLWLAADSGVRGYFMPAAWLAIGAIAMFRTIHGLTTAYSLETHFFPTHLRLDALLFGVVLAHIATYSPGAWSKLLAMKWAMFALGLLLIAPMLFLDRNRNAFVWTGGFALLYLGYGALLISVLAVKPGVGWDGKLLVSPAGRLLAWVGMYSYAIYLWHIDLALEPVSFHLHKAWMALPVGLGWAAATLTFIIAAILAGWVMTLAIERPFLALRGKLFPPAAGQPAKIMIQTSSIA